MVMPVSVVTWHILRRRVLALPGQEQQVWEKHRHQQSLNAKIRAKVEHPFRVLKCQFNFRKVRYKGLAQNIAFISVFQGFHILFGLDLPTLLERQTKHFIAD